MQLHYNLKFETKKIKVWVGYAKSQNKQHVSINPRLHQLCLCAYGHSQGTQNEL
jgi:hypothetical protein